MESEHAQNGDSAPATRSIRIATRASRLAIAQAELLRARIALLMPQATCEILPMSTTGDKQTHWTLQEHGGKGLFTKELEDALLEGRADLAVHSAKDLPTELPPGLVLAGCLPRADVRDVLVRRGDCPSPTLIASGSPRRRTQGGGIWPGALWTELRGNVETRLRKIAEGQAEATILAAAGLARLGITSYPGLVFDPIALERMIPAAGQAAIALECRESDHNAFSILADADTTRAVAIERDALAKLGGGCHSACAAYFDGKLLHLHLPEGGSWRGTPPFPGN